MTRPTWAACVAWVVIACTSGYGGPVTELLEWKIFKPLSRLTYSAYLIHPLVIYWYSATQDRPIHFTEITFVYQYIGNIVMTWMVAFVVALFVEWPMQELLRLALPSRKQNSVGAEQINPTENNLQMS